MKNRFIKTLNFLKDVLENSDETMNAVEHLIREIEVADDELFNLEKNNKSSQILEPSGEEFPVPYEIRDNEDSYAIFSDGACRGNPGPGSWGVMAQNSGGDIIYESSGVDVPTTNNKMELEGAIQGLELMKSYLLEENKLVHANIYLFSDSKYVIDGVTQWVPGWKSRGWKKADKKEPENLELWKRLDQIVNEFENVNFVWVKGHDGHPQNEHCDSLANKALDDSGF